MPTYADLPLVIVHQIIESLISFGYPTLDTWKLGLALMAVCKPWRIVAQPIMYATAFVFELEDFTGGATIATNIGLIKTGCLHNLVKCVYIMSNCEQSFQHIASSQIPTLKSLVPCWPNVKAIAIESVKAMLDFSDYLPSEPDMELPKQISVLSVFLASWVPRATNIHISLDTNKHLNRVIGDRLLELLGRGVSFYECNCTTVFNNQMHLANLTHLDTWLDAKSQHLFSKINLSILRYLKLRGIPDTFSWTMFAKSPYSPSVEFAALDKIFLEFATRPSPDSDRLYTPLEDTTNIEAATVSFPLLRNFTIAWLPNKAFTHANYILTGNLKKVNITLCMQAINLVVQKWNIKSLYLLRIFCRSIAKIEEEEFYQLTNSTFGSQSLVSHAKLCLQNLDFPVDYSRTKWDRVRELVLTKRCTYSNMLHIINKLDKLQRLVMIDFVVDHVPKDALNFMKYTTDPSKIALKPCHTKLDMLSIFACDFENNFNVFHFSSGLFYLLLKLPALNKLNIVDDPRIDLIGFVSRFKNSYPHISHIEFYKIPNE